MSRKKPRADQRRETVSHPDRQTSTQQAAATITVPPRDTAVESPPLGDRLLLISFVALAFLLGIAQLADTDLWWHLRTGQLILERGELPHTDWFTYTNPDSPWIDLHWGFQLLVAGLYRLGGLAPILLITAACGASTFGLLTLAVRPQWSKPATVACLLPSLLLFAGRYHPRPEMLTQLLLVGTLVLLFHVRRRPGLVWWLPVIQLLWVNVHSLFILGWIVGAFLFDAGVRWLWPGLVRLEAGERTDEPTDTPRDEPRDFQRWAIVSALMLLADLANPYGITGLTFPLVIFTRISSERDFYKQHAGEFQSMGEFLDQWGVGALFTSLSPLMLLVIAGLGVTSFVLLIARRRTLPVDRLLLFTAFAYLAWQANRNAALFALVGGYVLRVNFGEWSELRPVPLSSQTFAARFRFVVMLTVALLLLAVPLELFSFLRPIATRPLRFRLFALDEVHGWHAHEASRFLAQPGMPERVYAMHLGQAAVYLYHNGPQRRVFADPRLEVNTRDTLQRTLDVMRQLITHDPRAEENLRTGIEPDANGQRELPALLIDSETAIPMLPELLSNPRWRLVYADDIAFVFLAEERAERMGLRRITLKQLIDQ